MICIKLFMGSDDIQHIEDYCQLLTFEGLVQHKDEDKVFMK